MITLTAPQPFEDPIAKLAAKGDLPTELSTRELQLHTRTELRDRSFFSARVISAQILSEFKKGAENILHGASNYAKERLRLKQLLKTIDYRPEPGKEGTIEDLGSNRRLMVMLQTNVSMLRNYGQWKQMNRPGALLASPALALVRVSQRVNKRYWVERWNERRDFLGDATSATEAHGGRESDEINAFAMKNDPIWPAISRFGLPYPPFDFGSGMGQREVGYREAIDVGVMQVGDSPIAPPPLGMNDGLQASTLDMDDELLRSLDVGLSDDVEILHGVLRFKNESLRERTEGVLALMNAFDPSQPRDQSGRWISARDIANLHRRAKRGARIPTRGQNYRAVDEVEAHRVKAATGLDVRGYSHSVDEGAIRHIIRNHGNAETERQRGLVAIQSEDLAQLPRILARPDRISRLPDVEGHARIGYEKLQDGCVIVVEEVRRGRKQLALVSMYKKKRAVLSGTPGFPNAVWQTPEAFRAVNDVTALRDRGQAVLRFLEAR